MHQPFLSKLIGQRKTSKEHKPDHHARQKAIVEQLAKAGHDEPTYRMAVLTERIKALTAEMNK